MSKKVKGEKGLIRTSTSRSRYQKPKDFILWNNGKEGKIEQER